jgi:uncharacterized UPF0146 family protein
MSTKRLRHVRYKATSRCCDDVLPTNAARPFKNPAAILSKPEVLTRLYARSNPRVVEIGAGALRNALFLRQQGMDVTIVELTEVRDRFPEAYRRFDLAGGRMVLSSYTQHVTYPGVDRRVSYLRLPRAIKFDIALATFVIETICDPPERVRLLNAVRQHLTARGALIISVRGTSDVVTAEASGRRCSDGYVTPNRTFIRPYSRLQLLRLLRRAGFTKVQFLHKHQTKAPELLHAIAEG